METVWHLPLPEEGCGHFPFLQWWNCTSVEVLSFGEGRSPYLVSPSLWRMVVGPGSMHLLVTSPLQCAASPEQHVLSMRCLPVGPLPPAQVSWGGDSGSSSASFLFGPC